MLVVLSFRALITAVVKETDASNHPDRVLPDASSMNTMSESGALLAHGKLGSWDVVKTGTVVIFVVFVVAVVVVVVVVVLGAVVVVVGGTEVVVGAAVAVVCAAVVGAAVEASAVDVLNGTRPLPCVAPCAVVSRRVVVAGGAVVGRARVVVGRARVVVRGACVVARVVGAAVVV